MTDKLLTIILAFALITSLISVIETTSASLVVENVNQDKLYPGSDASLDIKLKNDFDYSIEDVKLTLIFNQISATGAIDYSKPTQFSSVGSSQDSVDEIDDDDGETFSFRIKASNSIEPGDYNLAYQVQYKNDNNTIVTELGSLGIKVNSKTLLDYSLSQQQKVIGMKDKITLKIINKGFGEVKFVSVQENSRTGYTLLSEEKVYIGSISSDDYDTASFDIIINKANPTFSALITYKDFENNDKSQAVSFDLTAYTKQKALELGLIKKSNAPLVAGIVIFVIILWFIVRWLRKRRKRKLNNLKNLKNSDNFGR
jgi:hypothetical protein